MKRHLIIASSLALVVFCMVSYFSVMTSLLASAGHVNRKPVANIGYPYHYYYQFWLRGNDSPNCGWRLGCFIGDFFTAWFLTITGYFIVLLWKNRNFLSLPKTKSD